MINAWVKCASDEKGRCRLVFCIPIDLEKPLLKENCTTYTTAENFDAKRYMPSGCSEQVSLEERPAECGKCFFHPAGTNVFLLGNIEYKVTLVEK
jgi:hypothetical protein